MELTADLAFWPSSNRFRLPGSGSRSVVILVGASRTAFGAVIVNPAGVDLEPGTSVREALITPWVPVSELPPVQVGDRLTLWMGGDIGEGVVTAIDR